MVRNSKSWELGEPEMNDRGQPVIHDIASKLGCIRPSPGFPVAFLEGAEVGAEDTGSRSHSSSPSSPSQAPTERTSSTDSNHPKLPLPTQSSANATDMELELSTGDDASYLGAYTEQMSFETSNLVLSPIKTDYQTQSSMFDKASTFPSWSANDDFLGKANAPDLTTHFMRAQQFGGGMVGASPLDGSMHHSMDIEPGVLGFTDAAVTLGMLDRNGSDPSSEMDTLMFGNEFEGLMDTLMFGNEFER